MNMRTLRREAARREREERKEQREQLKAAQAELARLQSPEHRDLMRRLDEALADIAAKKVTP